MFSLWISENFLARPAIIEAISLKGIALSDGVLGMRRILRTRGNFKDIFWSSPKPADALQYKDMAY